jgi:nifR3 family TIM-barrel protein
MISLGPFQLENPFILAPMAGVTDSPFRRVMRRRKCSLVVSELISANAIEYQSRKTLEMLRFHEEEKIFGVQIFGADPLLLCRAGCVVESLGADFIDVNLGCSVPKVITKGAGAALCREVSLLARVLQELVKAVRIPVAIKIRIGWDSGSQNALEVAKVAADAGVRWVAIHGRTSEQGYKGKADWDFIEKLKARSPIPVVGNGDINTPEAALHHLSTYGVDAVMIGRGALHNPFIFEQSRALWRGEKYELPVAQRYLDLIQEHRELLCGYYKPPLSLLHLRKFLVWYSASFPRCHKFRKEVFSILDFDLLWEKSKEFFTRNASRRKILTQPLFMSGHG